MKMAYESMKPGIITLDGFLGSDSRSLMDIIVADEAEIARRGLTSAELAQNMRRIRDEGRKGEGLFEFVQPHFDVLVESVRGVLSCPFPGCGAIKKVNTTVVNKQTGKTISFSDLAIHLIEEHSFFQGRGSSFRLDPCELIEILEIKEDPH
ncbi:MAG: hypothetical protein JXR95_13755 [Deltaproteobacteria bacterium]|nr:hypothetical protein [Deltaproteobacteria bacterium]